MIILIITFIILLLTLLLVGSLFYGLIGIPYVPTPQQVFAIIEKEHLIADHMLLIEPGSGDAGFLRYFAKRYDVKGIGYEVSPYVYLLSRLLILKEKVTSKVSILFASYTKIDFSDADIIYCYLLPKALKEITPLLQKAKKGCIIISYTFQIPDFTPYKLVPYKKKHIYLYKI